jgi:hypothetical protein
MLIYYLINKKIKILKNKIKIYFSVEIIDKGLIASIKSNE